jgi:hypothetical protein
MTTWKNISAFAEGGNDDFYFVCVRSKGEARVSYEFVFLEPRFEK